MKQEPGPDPRKLAIGRRIARARFDKGLSQVQLSVHLSVTDAAVAQWETGRTLPTMTNLHRVASALGVSVEWLLTGDEAAEALRAQTKAEESILRLARVLSPSQQATVIAMLAGLSGAEPPD